ncbi:WxcM-like domain-containing protein [Flavobacterium davisii]|uniref:WxcM-like domain-containing protein n=1 Tax=Flavobacterium davisii TaxID=2906077 RepID=UPI0035CEB5D4
MNPILIKGNCYQDFRGDLKYNNNFDASGVKRIYIIENQKLGFKRGWQGHKIEQRWFSVINGSFKIMLIEVDDWENPNSNLEPIIFNLDSQTFDVLHTPSGYITCIEALEENSKLLVLADYLLGELDDEYKFALDFFNCTK